ncbi:MAG: DUF6635 family protein [Acetobacteraceae bacterium]
MDHAPPVPAPPVPLIPAPPERLIQAAVADGIRRYIAARHERVAAFVDRHFSLGGSLAVHRQALGLDLLRAPANLVLMGPHAGMKAAGLIGGRLGARHLARRIEARSLLLRTDVSRRIEWLVLTELLELPCRQNGRWSRRDALAETILAAPRLADLAFEQWRVARQRAEETASGARLGEAILTYGTTRAAASDIAASMLTLASGALLLRQLTPGAVTLGPALAKALARRAAVSAFPLGPGLGSFWYARFPVVPSAALVAGLTGGLLVLVSVTAAFAGLVTDPIQRGLGLHSRRLHHLLDALERQLLDPEAPGFVVHDHYVARLIDLFDLVGSAWRFAAH